MKRLILLTVTLLLCLGLSIPAFAAFETGPCLIADEVMLTRDPATAGEAVTAAVTITNVGEKTARKIRLTVDYDLEAMTLQGLAGSRTLEGELGPGESQTVELTFIPALDTPEGNYKVDLDFQFYDYYAMEYSSKGSFLIPVRQGLEISLTDPQIPESASAGDTLSLSFQVLNLGRSGLQNVRVELEGDGLRPLSVAFMGNLEPGTEGTAPMNVFVSTLPGSNPYGIADGALRLLYEDTAGTEYKEEQTFSLDIQKPVFSAVPEPEDNTANTQWVLAFGMLGAALILVGGYFLLRRKRYA